MSAVTVSTRDYQLAHGRAPRGRGHWAFFFGFGRTLGGTVDPWFAPGELYYRDAKKAAVAQARAAGFTFVEVGS